MPKEDFHTSASFYEKYYEEGFTTKMPSANELHQLLTKGFTGHEKDFRSYTEVLKAAGLIQNRLILDFGASWGYGSWQLKKAGFEVVGYEINQTRARYAQKRLSVPMISSISQLPKSIDCFFSAHVMEHLPDPNILWKTAVSVLKPGGLFVAFMPNGDPQTESWRGSKRYHQLWGKSHPLLITGQHLKHMARLYNFKANIYSSPYPLEEIKQEKEIQGALLGDELCAMARRG